MRPVAPAWSKALAVAACSHDGGDESRGQLLGRGGEGCSMGSVELGGEVHTGVCWCSHFCRVVSVLNRLARVSVCVECVRSASQGSSFR